MMFRTRSLLSLAVPAAFALALTFGVSGTPVQAHPLGNFTTNHLTRLTVSNQALGVRYVLDLAEIPAFSVDRALDRDGKPSASALARWARRHAAEIAPALELTVDGRRVQLGTAHTTIAQRAGAGGLPTLYLRAEYRVPLDPGARRIVYRDRSESGRIGWKDVVLSPAAEPTHELRVYPSALVGSPRDRTALAVDVAADGAARIAADPSTVDTARTDAPSAARSSTLSELLAKNGGGPLFWLGALLLAIGLGALHALEPGHGKTLLAVSLVGARATGAQAFILASALTAAHTIGVLALGVVVLFATRWIVPEQIYPWITLLSGALVAVLGARALAAEIRKRRPFAHAHTHVHDRAHPHAHDHVHGLGAHDHHHEADHQHGEMTDEEHARAHAIPGTAPLTFRSAVLVAASGNIAPCPAALVVLLAAISLHRIGFGLALIVAFSIGLATVLTLLGIAVVRGAAWLSSRPQFDRIARYAPFVSAGVIAFIGAAMVAQGLTAQGIPGPAPFVAALVLLAIVGYAFAPPHRPTAPKHVHA